MFKKRYFFNRLYVVLFYLPLIFLIVVFVGSLWASFNVFAAVAASLTFLFLLIGIRWSFFRGWKLGADELVFWRPGVKHVIAWSEVRRYGIVKYRAFRFLFVSKKEELPFVSEKPTLTPGEHLFVLQYREKVLAALQKKLPGLQMEEFIIK